MAFQPEMPLIVPLLTAQRYALRLAEETTQTFKEEQAAPDRQWFYSVSLPRMGPRDRMRPHKANEIGITDLCRPGILMISDHLS